MVIEHIKQLGKDITSSDFQKIKKNLSAETVRISERGKRIKKPNNLINFEQKAKQNEKRSAKNAKGLSCLFTGRNRISLQLKSQDSSSSLQTTNSSSASTDGGKLKRIYTKRMTDKIRRWTKEESDKYEQFIEMNAEAMSDSNAKRVAKIFIIMSQFIGTKTPSQCRSHHQKFYNKQNRKRDSQNNYFYMPGNWEDISHKLTMLSQIRNQFNAEIDNNFDEDEGSESDCCRNDNCAPEGQAPQISEFIRNFNVRPSLIEDNQFKIFENKNNRVELDIGIKEEHYECFDRYWDERSTDEENGSSYAMQSSEMRNDPWVAKEEYEEENTNGFEPKYELF